MTKTTYTVKGIHCASCVGVIERKVKKVPGVASIAVNMATETAEVDSDLSVSEFNKVLEPLGYSFFTPYSAPSTSHHTFPLAFPIGLIAFFFMTWETLLELKMIQVKPPGDMWQHGFFLFILATINLFVFGRSYLVALYRFIRTRNANMDTLVGIGTAVAYVYSTFILFFPNLARSISLPTNVYFDVTAVVIGFIRLGKYLEANSKAKTGDAIKKLLGLHVKTALVVRNGIEVEVKSDDVKQGELIRCKPGSSIPLDGIIVEGESSVDESMITGESMPVDKQKGDVVIGGTLNSNGSLLIQITKVGSNTMLARIIAMVAEAQGSKAPIQRLADQISAVFVPSVLAVALIALISWLLWGSIPVAITAFVAILVIACPCAMGLATPTGIIVGVGKGANRGILIKNAESLEKLHKVDAIVIDKTGTLTTGKPSIVGIVDSSLLQIVASLESHSEHPISQAIVASATEKKVTLFPVTNFKNIPGMGLTGKINGIQYFAGNKKLMHQRHMSPNGDATIYLASDRLIGSIDMADTIKPNAFKAIESLHKLGIQVVMATGDNQKTAKAVAKKLNIDIYHAEVLPEEKSDIIKNLQQQGKVVAMVGDGINDAPALAQADVGIAMSTGTDVAIESAAITLLHGDIAKAEQAIRLSKATMAIIKQNLFWAFIYNILGIPLAAFGLLSPMLAGAAMALSSVSVVTNSLRLKTIRI